MSSSEGSENSLTASTGKFGVTWDQAVGGDGERLIYGDYLIPGADSPVYQRDGHEGSQRAGEEALDDYNSVTNAR